MRFEDSQFWFGALGDDLSHAVHRRTAAWLGTVVRVSALVLFASGVAAVLMHSMPVWSIYGLFAGATCFALVLDIAKRPPEAAPDSSPALLAPARPPPFPPLRLA